MSKYLLQTEKDRLLGKNVDLYIGGAEHATGHLLYARFWTKILFDLNLFLLMSLFKKLINQGMIKEVLRLFIAIKKQKFLLVKNKKIEPI